MPHVKVNDVNFHYWQLGEGPDLVMLHGLGGNLAVWHFAIVTHLRSGFRVTTYDLRGHGRTDMTTTGYTTASMADDLAAIMDELGIEKAHVIGHSFGADITLHFGLLHPDRVQKLVLIDAMLPVMVPVYMQEDWEGWTYWSDMIEQLLGVPVPLEKRHDVQYMMELSFNIPILFGPFRGRSRNRVPTSKLLTETSIVRDYDDPGNLTLENLPKITAETLLIYQANSPFGPTLEALQVGLPNHQLVLLPDSELRHFSPLEQPEMLLENIKTFIPPSANDYKQAERHAQ